MRYRGLSERTRLTRWGLVAVALGIVLGATGPGAVRDALVVWDAQRASVPWLLERLAAFLAYLAMAGSVIYGLMLSTKLLDAIAHRPISFTLHQDLASVGLGLAGVHGALLGLDATVPFTVPQMAVPGLAPYAPLAVAAGQAAFYLTAIIVLSFYVRRRIGQRTWRALHAFTFLAFAGATWHGLAAGTDSGSPWAQWLYTGPLVIVAFLFTYRLITVVSKRRAAPGRNRHRSPSGSEIQDLVAA